MIRLGELKLDSAEAIAAARRKVASVTQQVLGDGVAASRLGAVTSAVAKEMYRSHGDASIGIGIRSSAHGGDLVMDFCAELDQETVLRLSSFFDQVLQHRGHTSASMAYEGSLDSERLNQLQLVVQQKTRDELMHEVREQNLALEESLENLKRTRSARDRLESELNIGREIQMSMLPLSFPVFPDHHSFDVYATLHPAQQVGGDFYDIFLVDEDRLCVCVGDVSGKGVPAALFMAVTKTLVKSFAAHQHSPARILEQVNQEQAEGNESCMFVTILLAILDIHSGEVTYSNAGHNPPLLRRNNGQIERLDARHGPIIGAMEDLSYGEDSLQLQPGELLYLYTDGISEAMDIERQLYGEQRLLETLALLPGDAGSKAVVQGTVEPVWAWQGDAPQADDVTALGMRYCGAGTSAAPSQLSLRLENLEPEVGRAVAQVSAFLDARGVALPVQRKLATCLDEIIGNIIFYAYDDDKTHQIDVDLSCTSQELNLVIRDDGIAFDPFADDPPDTEASVQERAIGGLGCHLVKNLMDECAYRRENNFNIVSLRCKLES